MSSKKYYASLRTKSDVQGFVKGNPYLIEKVNIHKSSTTLEFQGISGRHSSCMFTYNVPKKSKLIHRMYLEKEL